MSTEKKYRCGTNPTAPKPGEPGYVPVWSIYRNSCRNYAKVERDGTWYCGIHDPVAKREKREAEQAARQREYDIQRERLAKFERERAVRKAAAEARIEKLAAFGVPAAELQPTPSKAYGVYPHGAVDDFTGGVTFSVAATDFLLAKLSALEARANFGSA